MQVLTIALFAYVGFVAFDFSYGLWQLWQASAKTAPVTHPPISDPWEGEIETPMIRGKQEEPKVTPQLLMTPAKEPESDLSKLTVAELHKMAQALKIKGARAMRKGDLIAALS